VNYLGEGKDREKSEGGTGTKSRRVKGGLRSSSQRGSEKGGRARRS